MVPGEPSLTKLVIYFTIFRLKFCKDCESLRHGVILVTQELPQVDFTVIDVLIVDLAQSEVTGLPVHGFHLEIGFLAEDSHSNMPFDARIQAVMGH